MINEQLINDAIIINDWIRENQYNIKDLPSIMHHFYMNVVSHKFQKDSIYWMKLVKLFKF